MRKRMRLRAQQALFNDIGRQLARAAHGARCGCPVNAPEADPRIFACPCGAHCPTCQHVEKES